MQGSDAQFLAPLGHILGSQHGCIRSFIDFLLGHQDTDNKVY